MIIVKLLTCNMLNHIQLLPFSWSCNFWPRRHGGSGWGWPRGRGWPVRLRRSSWGQEVTCYQSSWPSDTCCYCHSVTHPASSRQGALSVTSLLCESWSPTGSWLMFTHQGSVLRMWWLWCVAGSSLMCNTGSSSLMLIKFLRRFYLELFPHIILCISCTSTLCPLELCYIPEIMVCVKIIALMKSWGIFIWRHFPEPDAAIKVPCE